MVCVVFSEPLLLGHWVDLGLVRLYMQLQPVYDGSKVI